MTKISYEFEFDDENGELVRNFVRFSSVLRDGSKTEYYAF